ncbi:MAG TPA: toll/interleukin-1 receptor domain-containing protein [Pyrinomonadaceae bacterium]|nr:toll/interleukin-1 receptor domain-containing protein [Pyrinomonadaceae bacterium]
MTEETYNVFLSHSHTDATLVEKLAEQLEDKNQLKTWLDKWVVTPGGSFQQAIAKGLQEAKSCAVFLGAKTAGGWFEKEYEAALNRQAEDKSYRVIPVLLPGADPDSVNVFLKLNDWVDFRDDAKFDYAMHRLVCGIKGIPPGRWKPASGPDNAT